MINVDDVRENYMTAPEAAKYLGLTRNRVGRLCINGRFAGAVKLGNNWLIPREAVAHHERLKPGDLARAEDKAIIERLRKEISALQATKSAKNADIARSEE